MVADIFRTWWIFTMYGIYFPYVKDICHTRNSSLQLKLSWSFFYCYTQLHEAVDKRKFSQRKVSLNKLFQNFGIIFI